MSPIGTPSSAIAPSRHDAVAPCDTPTPQRRDWLLAFAAALILSDAFDAPLYAAFGPRATLPGVPSSRLLLLPVFAAAGLLLARDLRGAADSLRATWFVWPAVVLTFASAAWSDQPGTTILWATALLGTSLFGLALAVRFSAGAQCALVADVVSSIAVGSTVVALLWPAVGITGTGELWGLYRHQNLLGRIMALGVAAAGAVVTSGRRRILGLCAVFLSAGVLLASRSRASIFSAAIAVTAAMLLQAARRWRRHAAAILVSGAVVTVLAVAILVTTRPGLALVGRDETFSGRTRIWKIVAAGAMETPWLGHGYGAFWPGPAGQATLQQILELIHMQINHAHSGVLDLFAELGVLGVVLVLVPFAIVALAALRHALEPGDAVGIWPATYLVFFAASNAAESGLLRHKIYWALYVAVACTIARHRRNRSD